MNELNFTTTALSLGIAWVLWKVLAIVLFTSPLDKLPGPKPKSWLTGHIKDIFNRHGWAFRDRLATDYGPISKVHGLFGARILHVYDPLALNHILVKDSLAYDEASWYYESNLLTFGPALLATHGDHHRKQRKMLAPVFSANRVKEKITIFYKIAHKMRDSIIGQTKDGPREVDIYGWMSRAALELIGQGGLGYSFDPLTEKVPTGEPYGNVVKSYLPTLYSLGPLRLFSHHLKYLGSPSFRRKLLNIIPHKGLHKLRDVVDQMHDMSRQVFEDKKRALTAGDAAMVEQVGEGKDIMSTLLRANMVASEADRLPENELICQMAGLVFAAVDTTAVALTQILQTISEHPEAQDKMRAEIMEAINAHGGEIPYDELVDLPYMEAVYREIVRLDPPVTMVFRETTQDTVLPFTPIQGSDGKTLTEIEVPKGTLVLLSIRAANRHPDVWGEDVLEWKPERWLSPLPKSVSEAHIPGVYSNLMTFLGGRRSCIGFRFSQLEIKVILATLLSNFKFSLSENKDDIVWNLAGVRYPTVGRDTIKPSFPMKVERLSA